jgi:hypothetical protein
LWERISALEAGQRSAEMSTVIFVLARIRN